MSSSPPTTFGPYRIGAPLGSGGMGEVYRAHDTRLGRDVAIKILPAAFTSDPDRRARFEREARLLAALNHPHVATVHGRRDAPAVAPKRRTPLVAALPWTLLVFAAGSLAWFWSRPAGDGSLGGMQARPVTNDPGYTGEPALSPDGRLLAYSSDRAGAGNRDIWVQQVDGGNPLRLTDDLADDSRPDFSPDAGQIAFRSERNGGGVYVVPALGGTSRLLAQGGRSPKFSPDGTRIAYWTGQFRGSSAAMESEVYVVSLAGGAPVRLMRDFAVANNPIWAPDSRSLLVLGRRTMTGPASVLDFWRAPLTGDAAEATGVMGWQGLREEIVSTGRADLGLGSWTSRGFLLTDRGRAIQFLARDAAHDIVVAPSGQRIDRPSVPPDERAIAFRVGQGAKSRVYVAPLAGRTVPESQWTMIDESTNTGRPCGWSPDSSTLYLLLDTDGFRDLWGQKVEDGRPIGKPYVVRHLHKTTGVSTSLGNAITAQGFLYEAGRLTGNIWRLEPQSAAR